MGGIRSAKLFQNVVDVSSQPLKNMRTLSTKKKKD
jgi:hypothetical protein